MQLLHERKFIHVFPNLSIALRIYLSIAVANCESGRSFSKLLLIKNRLRSDILDGKHNLLAMMSIESDLLHDLSFEQTISDIAKAQARKMQF
uniref:Putative hat family dimerization domain protein n=1 Tax=Ixodes ricinus TaxID=34613 RepID=A0A0K8RLB2_IXORI